MSKFNLATLWRATGRGPIRTALVPQARTYEGAPAWLRDARGELFLLAVTHLAGEDTFYEAASARDARLADLVRRLAVSDADWTARFIAWLRDGARLRSVSIAAAAEFVAARRAAGLTGGNRAVVASVLLRAAEPGEFLACWLARHGRALPQPVKRGVADAARRLYTERSLLKWDSAEGAVRFGDVLELVHPAPVAAWQGDLFGYAISRRHGRADVVPPSLTTLTARSELLARPVSSRRDVLATPEVLAAAGMTWESLAGWLQGPLDAAAWEAVTPSIGYMALVEQGVDLVVRPVEGLVSRRRHELDGRPVAAEQPHP